LPNGLHYEWALRALKAGKHVLVEKPSVSNAVEAEKLFGFHAAMPHATRPVLLEAFHFRFHPAWHTFLSLLDPLQIENVRSDMSAPAGFLRKNDIRFNYELGGGATMDMGTYNIAVIRGVFGDEPEECVAATARTRSDRKVDGAMTASFRFPGGGTAEMEADLAMKGRLGLPWIKVPSVVVRHKEVVVEDGTITEGQEHVRRRTVTFWNFIAPVVVHDIEVREEHVVRVKEGGNVVRSWVDKEKKKAYTWTVPGKNGEVRVGEAFWTTYRHMLEQFANKIKGRPGSGAWVDGEDSVKQMKVIDAVYEKAGLPKRGALE